MTVQEIQETQDKSIKKVPVVLWNRFVGRCKTNGMTVTQGIIEALDLFLESKSK